MRTSKLHDEIFAFAQASITRGEAAHAEVQGILASLRALVSTRWPQATVELYGSRATGLSLASSDVDVTLLGVPCGAGREAVGGALKELHALMEGQPWVASQKLVLSARIPVLKVATPSSIPIDITISDSAQHTGLLARDLVLGYLSEAPQLTPLVLVLKSFLRELGLNDPYTGGMSSYSLVVLLWLFVCESAHRGYNTTDLGYQLLGFFSMFLYRFDSQVTHVDDPLSPMITAPGEPRENIMHSCYQIGRVCRTFHRALQLLSPETPEWDDPATPLLPRLFSEASSANRATQTEATATTPPPAAARTPPSSGGSSAAASAPPPDSAAASAIASVVEELTAEVEAQSTAEAAAAPPVPPAAKGETPSAEDAKPLAPSPPPPPSPASGAAGPVAASPECRRGVAEEAATKQRC